MAHAITPPTTGEKPQEMRSGHVRLGYRLLRAISQTLFRVAFRVRVEGIENVPGTPVIICANHLGWTDVLLVTLFLPIEPRTFVVGDKGVKNVSRFLRFMVENFGVIQLDRGKPIEALRTMKSVIGQGGSLLIFPEGNLGTEEGALLPLQNGAAHVSVQTGAPVLPVGLTGTSKLWIRRHLTVRIGVPMKADAPDTGSLHSRLDEFTGRIGMAMQTLMPGDDDFPKVRLMEKRLTELF